VTSIPSGGGRTTEKNGPAVKNAEELISIKELQARKRRTTGRLFVGKLSFVDFAETGLWERNKKKSSERKKER